MPTREPGPLVLPVTDSVIGIVDAAKFDTCVASRGASDRDLLDEKHARRADPEYLKGRDRNESGSGRRRPCRDFTIVRLPTCIPFKLN